MRDVFAGPLRLHSTKRLRCRRHTKGRNDGPDPNFAQCGVCDVCLSCGQPFPATAKVHAIDAAREFVEAYKQAQCKSEQELASSEIITAIDQLNALLQRERTQYARLGSETREYYAAVLNMSLHGQIEFCNRGPSTIEQALRGVEDDAAILHERAVKF